jgi:Vitamin K-dependent gamma-carboxylase
VTGLVDRLWLRWQQFWFAPEPTSTLAVVRIVYGVIAFLWTVTLLPDLHSFFAPSSRAVLPGQPSFDYWVGLLDVFRSPAMVWVVFAALLAGTVALTVGWHTRLAAVVVFVGLLSFERRNPFVLNSGDLLVRHVAFYLMFAPAGVSLSLDRWRRVRRSGGEFWAFPARSPWALRLIQVQVSVIYLFTLWEKVKGTTWNDGTAVSYALRIADLTRFHVPTAISQNLTAANLMTFGTLATELSIATLVWNRRARPWVLGAGVLLHLGIELTIMVGFFSWTIFCTYLAFVPPDTMTRWLSAVRDRRRRPSGESRFDLA